MIFIEKSVGLDVILQYYISYLPSIIVQTSTMACLISVLFTYSTLNAHNEINAIRASGMNFWQITRPALVFALFVSALVLLSERRNSYRNPPWSTRKYATLKSKSPLRSKGKGNCRPIHNLTFYGLKNRLFFIDTFDPNTNELTGITIIGHDHNQNLVEKIVALKAHVDGLCLEIL